MLRKLCLQIALSLLSGGDCGRQLALALSTGGGGCIQLAIAPLERTQKPSNASVFYIHLTRFEVSRAKLQNNLSRLGVKSLAEQHDFFFRRAFANSSRIHVLKIADSAFALKSGAFVGLTHVNEVRRLLFLGGKLRTLRQRSTAVLAFVCTWRRSFANRSGRILTAPIAHAPTEALEPTSRQSNSRRVFARDRRSLNQAAASKINVNMRTQRSLRRFSEPPGAGRHDISNSRPARIGDQLQRLRAHAKFAIF